MYLSNSDEVNNTDVDDTSQMLHGNTPLVTSIPSKSSSPSCPTLLVAGDNSTSHKTTLNKTDIPSNSSTEMSHMQTALFSSLMTLESSKDKPDQERRRTSSIARLLGGQPLNNQQYEDIHQQILDDQSSQSISNNNDNNSDGDIQRSRSSKTRTMLMKDERNDNASMITVKARSLSPGFSKDVEYLIRRELDIEHEPSTFNRNSATPSIFQNVSSVRNTTTSTSPSSQASRLKRKRLNSRSAASTSTINKSSNNPPFSINDPFELDNSESSLNSSVDSTPIHRSHHHQNDLYRFDASHSQTRLQCFHQAQQHYTLPINGSTPNSPALTYHNFYFNSSVYAQFKTHHDRLSTTNCSSSSPTSSCNCCRYPMTAELSLPASVLPLSLNLSSASLMPHQNMSTSSHENKASRTRPDIYEIPVQRSYCTTNNQSDTSLSAPSLSSGHSVPLKKRLLHAYKNEHCSSSSL